MSCKPLTPKILKCPISDINSWRLRDRINFREHYDEIQSAIKGTTGLITSLNDNSSADVFYMLCFCLLVPQSKADLADAAVTNLKIIDFFNDEVKIDCHEMSVLLCHRVRFHNVKSVRLLDARKNYAYIWDIVLKKYQEYKITEKPDDRYKLLCELRDVLVSSVNGMGYKCASHFLRNISMRGLSILDVHILSGLHKRGIISSNSKSMTHAKYLSIENKFFMYADQVGISPDEMDFLFWREKTGYVFK